MKIDIMTLFPDLCEAYLCESIIGRARKKGAVDIVCHNIRDYTKNKQKQVDDYPYGGGSGVVMQADPIYECYRSLFDQKRQKPYVVYMTPQGKTLTQQRAAQLSQLPHVAVLCGHYEGVDERIIEKIVDEQISIGDYVVTGGELPALILVDCVCRMLPGVLSGEEAYTSESHFNGLLE